jgi:nicotinate-nucleotide adenylyltransferase
VREDCALDYVLFITSARPPHKEPHPLVSFEHRHTMLKLAIEGASALGTSDLENRRRGLSYSVETLDQLKKEFPSGTEYYFIIGVDAFLEIETWKNYRHLFEQCTFIVLNRPGFSDNDIECFITETIDKSYSFIKTERIFRHPRFNPIYYRKTTLLDISSSSIREYVRLGRSIRFLVPERVEQYIFQKGLYKE